MAFITYNTYRENTALAATNFIGSGTYTQAGLNTFSTSKTENWAGTTAITSQVQSSTYPRTASTYQVESPTGTSRSTYVTSVVPLTTTTGTTTVTSSGTGSTAATSSTPTSIASIFVTTGTASGTGTGTITSTQAATYTSANAGSTYTSTSASAVTTTATLTKTFNVSTTASTTTATPTWWRWRETGTVYLMTLDLTNNQVPLFLTKNTGTIAITDYAKINAGFTPDTIWPVGWGTVLFVQPVGTGHPSFAAQTTTATAVDTATSFQTTAFPLLGTKNGVYQIPGMSSANGLASVVYNVTKTLTVTLSPSFASASFGNTEVVTTTCYSFSTRTAIRWDTILGTGVAFGETCLGTSKIVSYTVQATTTATATRINPWTVAPGSYTNTVAHVVLINTASSIGFPVTPFGNSLAPIVYGNAPHPGAFNAFGGGLFAAATVVGAPAGFRWRNLEEVYRAINLQGTNATNGQIMPVAYYKKVGTSTIAQIPYNFVTGSSTYQALLAWSLASQTSAAISVTQIYGPSGSTSSSTFVATLQFSNTVPSTVNANPWDWWKVTGTSAFFGTTFTTTSYREFVPAGATVRLDGAFKLIDATGGTTISTFLDYTFAPTIQIRLLQMSAWLATTSTSTASQAVNSTVTNYFATR